MPESLPPIAVAITGASGAQYGLRLLDCLVEQDRDVYLMVSQAGQVVLRLETELEVPNRPQEAERFFTEYFGAEPGQIRVFGRQEWTAPVASGSNPPEAMVICPCTTGTLASIAAGVSNDLIDRAADVMLKERRKLVLVFRETPISLVHARAIAQVVEAGPITGMARSTAARIRAKVGVSQGRSSLTAHRPAHEAEAGEFVGCGRWGRAFVDLD